MLKRGYLVLFVSCLTTACAAVLLISTLYEPRFSWSPTVMIAIMGAVIFGAEHFLLRMMMKYAPDFVWMSAMATKILSEKDGDKSGISLRTGYIYTFGDDSWDGKVYSSLDEISLAYNMDRNRMGYPVEGREGVDPSHLPPWFWQRESKPDFNLKISDATMLSNQLPDSSLEALKKRANKARQEEFDLDLKNWKMQKEESDARMARMSDPSKPILGLPGTGPSLFPYAGYVQVPKDNAGDVARFFEVSQNPREDLDGYDQIRVRVIPIAAGGLRSQKPRRRKKAHGPQNPLLQGPSDGTGSGTDGDS